MAKQVIEVRLKSGEIILLSPEYSPNPSGGRGSGPTPPSETDVVQKTMALLAELPAGSLQRAPRVLLT